MYYITLYRLQAAVAIITIIIPSSYLRARIYTCILLYTCKKKIYNVRARERAISYVSAAEPV